MPSASCDPHVVSACHRNQQGQVEITQLPLHPDSSCLRRQHLRGWAGTMPHAVVAYLHSLQRELAVNEPLGHVTCSGKQTSQEGEVDKLRPSHSPFRIDHTGPGMTSSKTLPVSRFRTCPVTSCTELHQITSAEKVLAQATTARICFQPLLSARHPPQV